MDDFGGGNGDHDNDGGGVVDRPTQLICISDVNIQIQKT